MTVEVLFETWKFRHRIGAEPSRCLLRQSTVHLPRRLSAGAKIIVILKVGRLGWCLLLFGLRFKVPDLARAPLEARMVVSAVTNGRKAASIDAKGKKRNNCIDGDDSSETGKDGGAGKEHPRQICCPDGRRFFPPVFPLDCFILDGLKNCNTLPGGGKNIGNHVLDLDGRRPHHRLDGTALQFADSVLGVGIQP